MKVKSADRVLAILELLDDVRAPLSVGEIARRLGYPQSSTTELLQTLSGRGYIHFDRINRKYAPTLLVSLLGAWRLPEDRGGNIVRILGELRRRTGCTITMGVRHTAHAKVIYRVIGDRLPSVPGTLRPLCRSAVGQALLTTSPDPEIGKLVRYINSNTTSIAKRVDLHRLMRRINDARERGYACTDGDFNPSMGAVSVLMSIEGHPVPVAIAAGAPVDYIQKNTAGLAHELRSLRHSLD